MGDNYCDRHDVDIDSVPGHSRCPYCEEEERVRQAEAERQQRIAPRSVDDPATIDAYRR